jgi:hypothetical protein
VGSLIVCACDKRFTSLLSSQELSDFIFSSQNSTAHEAYTKAYNYNKTTVFASTRATPRLQLSATLGTVAAGMVQNATLIELHDAAHCKHREGNIALEN